MTSRMPAPSARTLASAAALLLLGACSQESASPPVVESPASPAPAISDLRVDPDLEGAAVAATAVAPTPAPGDDTATLELEWDALIPDDFRPDKLLEEFQVEDIADDDPRAQELMDRLREVWDQAPVRDDLDGRLVKLPGFVVPVEADADETTGFLLVPYYGACVHVPPPPANQTVYVVTETGKGTRPELFDVIWVTGTMSVKRIDNDIAEAGYTLYANDIAPYDWPVTDAG